MMEPYWLKVLDHFLNRNYVQNGLTIPFLIGSELLHNSTRKEFTVTEIIDQMQNENLKLPISVMRCDNIGEYVFGILDQESVKYNLKDSIYRAFKNLTVTDDSLNIFKDLESITTEFETCYGKHIVNKEYSKHNGKWSEFSIEESSRVLEVVGS